MMYSSKHRRIAEFRMKCLSERDRALGVVRSTPEHIHFTVFSSNLPLDITSLPLQAIIPPFAIIYVSKPSRTHILTVYVHSQQKGENHQLLVTAIKGMKSL